MLHNRGPSLPLDNHLMELSLSCPDWIEIVSNEGRSSSKTPISSTGEVSISRRRMRRIPPERWIMPISAGISQLNSWKDSLVIIRLRENVVILGMTSDWRNSGTAKPSRNCTWILSMLARTVSSTIEMTVDASNDSFDNVMQQRSSNRD